MSVGNLIPNSKILPLVDQWLLEDAGSFDIGGVVAGGEQLMSAELLCKCAGDVILSGVPFFDAVFRRLQCTVEWGQFCIDGSSLPNCESSKRRIAIVRGPVASILQGERPALNCISRASGIATNVGEIVGKARKAGWNGRIACTRKTTPGFRLVEKYAVICGGGDPHRYDMGSSMVMLKDNHVDACGGDIRLAINTAKQLASFSTKIEVEARTTYEAEEAASAGADVVMLDNFSSMDAKSNASLLKSRFPNITIEVSGGIDTHNFMEYLHENIDVISMGCLTQGYSCIDFSLKVIGNE